MPKSNSEIPLRIVITQTPPGVVFAIQRGKKELSSPTLATGEDLVFDLAIRVDAKGSSPNLLGPYVQGPRGARFVYVNSGTLAGQSDSCWSRRAKVSLEGITWNLLDRVKQSQGKILEARIAGKAKDGGPTCASVPLLNGGWRLVKE